MPADKMPDSARIPGDSATLILEWLPEHYKAPTAIPDRMLTESGRMGLVQEYAKYDLCRNLKATLEKQMQEKER